ncbi:hypothetical protein SAMN05192583_3147 [Sphingomonas gellani]|uniref:Uncharacterized protein n=1 Tax=Sphingomonas gellani TaxID=1166340 RepID=A0A1H8HYP3_9SPHN|nr:XrtV sorting system accessory protein [Sphingomonas gellani]SEN61187.1 hypothetical protein SAMN05192583_3147 [Sphingomonas gellani]
MTTPYDWLTVAVFAGLIVLFLSRSDADRPRDSLWQYLVASLGCALVNWLGNGGHAVAALAAGAALAAFILIVLDPLGRRGGPPA